MKNIILMSLFSLFYFSADLTAEQLNPEESSELKTIIELSKKLDPANTDLVINGKISKLNPARFDLNTFKRLKSTSFQSTNHWTGDKEKFTGVSFIYLLRLLGLDKTASSVEVAATNDYRISIKISDIEKYEYVLSYALNDKDYSEHEPAKDKGPIAIAINFDKHPDIDRDIYKHHLVWFVEMIMVH